MKLRSALLILVVLLAVAGVAGASPNPVAPSSTAPAVSLSAPTDAAPACGSSTTLSASIFTPAPSARTFINACGACSSSPCAGAANNAICGFRGGQYGHCLSPLGDQCTEGGWACECWYGPLP